jgi:endonuclease/exonuclease/phosphatase family metal-dependent hydrolase
MTGSPMMSYLPARLHASYVIAAALISLCASGSSAQTTEESLSVATYNINFSNQDLPAVIESIRESGADVVCLQETNRESYMHIRRTLGETYSEIRFNPPDDQAYASGFGVLSKYPIDEAKFIPPEHGMFGTCVMKIDFEGRPIQVVDVHLEPIRLRRGGSLASLMSAMIAAERTRIQEIQLIHESIELDLPTLIAGDFNSMPGFQTLEYLEENGFIDSFSEVHEESQPTWHWPNRIGEWRLRLDYIWHDEHFTTTESEILESDASDHYLLVSRMKFYPDGVPETLTEETTEDFVNE